MRLGRILIGVAAAAAAGAAAAVPAAARQPANLTWQPVLDHTEGAGFIAGVRLSSTRFTLGRIPQAHRRWAEAAWGFGARAPSAEVGITEPLPRSRWSVLLRARGSWYDATRHYGFGNDTPEPADPDATLIRHDRLHATAGLSTEVRPGLRFTGGVTADHYAPEPQPPPRRGAPPPPFGTAPFGAVLFWVEGEADRGAPARGWHLTAGASAAPAAWDVPRSWSEVHAELRTWAQLGTWPALYAGPVLALRGAGERVSGGFPVQEAAAIGGRSSVRGYRSRRYAGDAALHGSAELRLPIGRTAGLRPDDLGVLGLADGGRVWYRGESPGGWHTAAGAGFWINLAGNVVTVAAARGDAWRGYLYFGLPF